jgi:hypothetical protein
VASNVALPYMHTKVLLIALLVILHATLIALEKKLLLDKIY